MKRGLTTKGRVAGTVAGVDGIEIKATIPDFQIDKALARFNLAADSEQARYIYFFDTPALDLFAGGIVARARRIVGEEHDSTVKARPVVPENVAAAWRKYRGFKIEADVSEKGVVKSASLTMPVEKGLIKAVVAGAKPIVKLFTKEQEVFLAEMVKGSIDYHAVAIMGPLRAQRWKLDDPACPWTITAELWHREDGARLMEASIKTPIAQAAAAIAGFMAFLAEMGAESDAEDQTKTRWALNYYAAKLADTSSARDTN